MGRAGMAVGRKFWMWVRVRRWAARWKMCIVVAQVGQVQVLLGGGEAGVMAGVGRGEGVKGER